MLLRLLDRFLAPPANPARVGWLTDQDYAHRGLHGDGAAPENSLAAFDAAIERGLGIECDVQRTADRDVVVFHDWELDRLTGSTGPVARRSIEDLSGIALSGRASDGSTQTIASLPQVLSHIAGRAPLLIEVKSKDDLRVIKPCLAVRRAVEGYRGKVAVMSFDPRVSRWFARHGPHVVRGLVITEDGARTLAGRLKRRVALWHARPDFIAYDIRDLPSSFAQAQRARGLPLLSWTVRTGELRRVAEAAGATPIAEGEGLAQV